MGFPSRESCDGTCRPGVSQEHPSHPVLTLEGPPLFSIGSLRRPSPAAHGFVRTEVPVKFHFIPADGLSRGYTLRRLSQSHDQASGGAAAEQRCRAVRNRGECTEEGRVGAETSKSGPAKKLKHPFLCPSDGDGKSMGGREAARGEEGEGACHHHPHLTKLTLVLCPPDALIAPSRIGK
jgi:hypothetical protein